jgi:hypothetical protein
MKNNIVVSSCQQRKKKVEIAKGGTTEIKKSRLIDCMVIIMQMTLHYDQMMLLALIKCELDSSG